MFQRNNCSSSGGLYQQLTVFYRASLWGIWSLTWSDACMNIYTYHFIFQHSPHQDRGICPVMCHVTNLLTFALQNSVPCNFNHLITAVFMLLSLANSRPLIWSYRVGKRWKSLSARYGLHGRYSKTVHLKHCESCVLQLRHAVQRYCAEVKHLWWAVWDTVV